MTLQWDEKVLHTSADFASWLLDGLAPTSAQLTGCTLSLAYGQPITAAQVLDLSGCDLYDTPGVKIPDQKRYAGTQVGQTLGG